MVCLPNDEDLAGDVLESAASLTSELKGDMVVVHVFPRGSAHPPEHQRLAEEAHAASWYLESDTPAEAIVGFARTRRVTHVLFGPVAWKRWGKPISDIATATGVLALLWVLTGSVFGASVEFPE